MAKTIEQLKAQSAEVKNASVIGENTATRVGTLFNDIVEHVEAYEAGQAQKNTEQSTSINEETNRATAAETTLSERINQEVTDRKAMDETIATQLSNEIERAKGMELGISTKLNDEIKRAQEAENDLQEKITSEAEARDLAINAEAQARTQNDQLLSQAIAAEQERAEAAEQANAWGAIYDVSVNNDGAVFESLSALLSDSNLSTLIPISVRRGGMSIRFVQSSDNKYMQYRYMKMDVASSATFTDTSNWQGVDDEPVAGSENLVKSGGVAKEIMPKFLNAYISGGASWVIGKNSRSFYIFCHKGDVITVAPNEGRDKEYISFLSSVDTSVKPVFANGTNKANSISESTDFVLNEDCYVLLVDTAYGAGGIIEDWSPSILELNHVSLLTELYDQLVSSLNSLALIDERISLPFEINNVNGHYFNKDGTWRTIEGPAFCSYCQLKSGDIFSATGAADYGSRIAFITSVPNPPETLIFADGTTSSIDISANNKYTRKVNVDCYVIWINYLSFGSGQAWAPYEMLINSFNIVETNAFKHIQELGKVVSNIEGQVSNIEGQVSNIEGQVSNIEGQVSNIEGQVSELEIPYVKNLATYYQKGGSPKTFDSNKKICIITAGQSNTDGRVPYADMPESIKNAQPIVDCQIVRNSETNAFSSLSITENWAFDLITYYNLVTRNNLSIYAIKWAVGGTSIDPLGDSQSHWTADYEELPSLSGSLLLKFEREIRNHIASDGEDFSIRAMLWHQGEGDRGSLGTGSADRYYKNLSNMIAYIRGIVGNERLPFITGTISHNSAQYDAKIEAAQYQIASEDPYYYLIDMSGATLLDSYHFDAVSTEYFGEMAYDKLIDAGVISGTKINPIAPWEI